MNWFFSNPEAERELGKFPERRLAEIPAEPVKSGVNRQVFRGGGYFWKKSDCDAKKLLSEFSSALLLAELGVPTVEYLACGVERDTGRGILVTRAYPGASSVLAYQETHFRNGSGGSAGLAFRRDFARFAKTVLTAGIYHPDFHLGNVLYGEKNGKFVLVDVYKVRRENWFDCFLQYPMQRIVLELREGVGEPEMFELLTLAGIREPAEFYRRGLKREAAALEHEWPRRRKQILSGYAKFIEKSHAFWRVLDRAGNPIPMGEAEAETFSSEQLKEELLQHFRMRFELRPHRRVAAVDWESGRLYHEAEKTC